MTDIPTVTLQSSMRLWWVCPACGRENEPRQKAVSQDDMREALGVEPWQGEVAVQEGFTVPERDRCAGCELVVTVQDEEQA